MSTNKKELLGTAPVGTLLIKFAIPSIVAMMVSALYNMVDQIFIGNYVGELGNAATNVAFPFSSLCTATALMFGIGGSAAFNLSMGRKETEKAGYFVGNAISSMVIIGTIIATIGELFMPSLLTFFGSPSAVLPYALTYTRITAIGIPILILSIGGGHLIRADGKPTVAMTCNLTGAIVNTILDALFVAVFKWGMAGAAIATVIGQACAALLVIYNLCHYQTVKLTLEHLKPQPEYYLHCANLGMSQGFNQLAMMIVQIVLNNSLKYYGRNSVYGENIPIAVVGVVTKVAMIYFSICIGLSQGLQPIASFNYGAKQYSRARLAYLKAMATGLIAGFIAFALFQTFPLKIVSIFGEGSPEYYAFAVKYFKVYLFFTCINCVQPMSSTFFSAIGKPKSGLFLSLTRQIIFLLPMIVVLPLFFGIDGIMYAGPIADGMAFLVAGGMIIREFSRSEYVSEDNK